MALLLLSFPAAGVAWADGPTEEDLAQSREYFEEGAEAFFEERYGRALVLFRRAHRLNPHPMILYNKSLAHLRLGNFGQAYRRGLEASQMEGLPQREWVRNEARTAALAVRISADAVAESMQPRITGEEETEGVEEEDRQRADAEEEVDPQVAGPPEDRVDEEEGGLGAVGWTGVAMTTTGVGLLAFAGVTDLRLRAQIEDYENASVQGDREAYFALRDDIDRATRQGQIALYAGVGLATVGAAMWFLGGRSGSSSSLQLTSAIVPGTSSSGFIQLNGRF